MSDPIIRKRYVLTGTVQGVGLRWRARHAAQALGVCGWVQNAWDGSVTLELQGRAAQLDRLLQTLLESRYIQIDRIDVQSLAPDPDARGFHVLDDRW